MDSVNEPTNGLKTAVDETHDPAAKPPGTMDGDQLDLLPLRKAKGRAADAQGKDVATRGRGRPPGAKNKRTQEWVDHVLSRYPSPLIALSKIAFRPLGDLGDELLKIAGAADGWRRSKPARRAVMKITTMAGGRCRPSVRSMTARAPFIASASLCRT